jgi:S-methylmethionine-dependent homocysteine/selenocysteine methylase
MNLSAIALMEELRDRYDAGDAPIVISGCLGPQDDGYNPSTKLSAADAQDYHAVQIATFGDTAADMVTAITMTYADEALGIALAAREAGLPAAISFTLETDGRLPSGQPLGEATELDEGDPAELGARYAALKSSLPRLNVLGGCCGTDDRHVCEIRDTWLASDASAAR